jgi:hypothetical protein
VSAARRDGGHVPGPRHLILARDRRATQGTYERDIFSVLAEEEREPVVEED